MQDLKNGRDMKIERIITNRRGCKAYYWQIVYEWEDSLSQCLNVRLFHNCLANRWLRCPWRWFVGTMDKMPITKKNALAFVLFPFFLDDNISNKKNIIPVIIDFWKRSDADVAAFEERYRANPAVLITSRQVYDFLKEKRVSLNLFHWPLSLPDKYQFQPHDKKYDCVLVGRPSIVLRDWMLRYSNAHADFVYVYNDRDSKRGMLNYVTSKGNVIGSRFNSRQSYFELLRSSKVGLYSTPSIDGDKKLFNNNDSNGYDQVTPRLFEYIAAGCHVMARYPENSDTAYFGLNAIAPHIATYEEFEARMDYARANPVDSQSYADWLSRHYTSVRARMLEKIMEGI